MLQEEGGGGGARQRINNEQSCSCLLACLLSYFDFIVSHTNIHAQLIQNQKNKLNRKN